MPNCPMAQPQLIAVAGAVGGHSMPRNHPSRNIDIFVLKTMGMDFAFDSPAKKLFPKQVYQFRHSFYWLIIPVFQMR